MMRDEDRIAHLRRAIADAKESISGIDRERFLANKDKMAAAERYILIVGEASHMVSAAFKAAHPEIPWQDMRDMRNIIAHEYMNVDYNEVWNAVTRDFDELKLLIDRLDVDSEVQPR